MWYGCSLAFPGHQSSTLIFCQIYRFVFIFSYHLYLSIILFMFHILWLILIFTWLRDYWEKLYNANLVHDLIICTQPHRLLRGLSGYIISYSLNNCFCLYFYFYFLFMFFFFSVSFGVRPMGRSKTAYYVRLFESWGELKFQVYFVD